MIDGVLTRFLMLDLDESFSKASFVYFEYPDPISQEIINAKTYQETLSLEETKQNQTWLNIIEVKSSYLIKIDNQLRIII